MAGFCFVLRTHKMSPEKTFRFGRERKRGRTRSKGLKSQTFLPPPGSFASNGDLRALAPRMGNRSDSSLGCTRRAIGALDSLDTLRFGSSDGAEPSTVTGGGGHVRDQKLMSGIKF
jgi:hypothetical protein